MAALVLANVHLLDQAVALASHFLGHLEVDYGRHVGPHLRHVIEHLEMLCLRTDASQVDYDSRRRDALVERRPELAVDRLQRLRAALCALPPSALGQALEVRGCTGPTGLLRFAVASSLGRELAFMASHLVHHFAIVRPHAEAAGWVAPAHFGKAAGTVAHELATLALPTQPAH